MKNLRLLLFLIFTTISLPSICLAMLPPPPRTLEQRVAMATHVFVGVVRRVRVMEVRGGKVQQVIQTRGVLDAGQWAELEIEIKEVLYPSWYKPMGTVKYSFGDGMFSVASIKKDTLGKKRIYLLKAIPKLKQHFFPSWSWHLSEPLSDKPKIQRILRHKKPASPLRVPSNAFMDTVRHLQAQGYDVNGFMESYSEPAKMYRYRVDLLSEDLRLKKITLAEFHKRRASLLRYYVTRYTKPKR